MIDGVEKTEEFKPKKKNSKLAMVMYAVALVLAILVAIWMRIL